MFSQAATVAKLPPASTIRLFKETSGKAASGTRTPTTLDGSNTSGQQRAEDAFPFRPRTDDFGPFDRFDNALRRCPNHADNIYSEEVMQSLEKFLKREAYKKERETNSSIQQLLIRRTQKNSIRELGILHRMHGVEVYSRSSTRGRYIIGELNHYPLESRKLLSSVCASCYWPPHSMRKRLFAGLQRSTE